MLIIDKISKFFIFLQKVDILKLLNTKYILLINKMYIKPIILKKNIYLD